MTILLTLLILFMFLLEPLS